MTPTTRRGDWICTASGRRFWPLDPRATEIEIEDIAHALSNLCRFGGHCRSFYSVAQHSVHVAWLCQREDALWGLLHDAPEAYLVDLPRPIKQQPDFVPYRLAEAKLMARIMDRFGLGEVPRSVLDADEVMLATEARDLMDLSAHPWTLSHKPDPNMSIRPWAPTEARVRFLDEFRMLYREGA